MAGGETNGQLIKDVAKNTAGVDSLGGSLDRMRDGLNKHGCDKGREIEGRVNKLTQQIDLHMQTLDTVSDAQAKTLKRIEEKIDNGNGHSTVDAKLFGLIELKKITIEGLLKLIVGVAIVLACLAVFWKVAGLHGTFSQGLQHTMALKQEFSELKKALPVEAEVRSDGIYHKVGEEWVKVGESKPPE